MGKRRAVLEESRRLSGKWIPSLTPADRLVVLGMLLHVIDLRLGGLSRT